MFTREKERSVTLYCFTPGVSLATFFIETIFALYVAIRYKMNAFGRLSALLLLLLGAFQLAEYSLCQGMHPLPWTQIAFVSITPLPIISFHLIALVTRKSVWTNIGYALAAAFIAVIVASPTIFLGSACTGRFVVFNTSSPFIHFYTAYYLGFLTLGIVKAARSAYARIGDRTLLAWLLLGYASFIAPTIALYVYSAVTRSGFASILCGFAVLFACILVVKILPLQEKKKKISA